MGQVYQKEEGYRKNRLAKKTRHHLFRYALETEYKFHRKSVRGLRLWLMIFILTLVR